MNLQPGRVNNGSRRNFFLLSLICFVFPLQSCRTLGQGSAGADELSLSFSLDKKVYRPGEAALVTAELVNHGGRARQVREPTARSVEFFLGRVGDPERMERGAVEPRGGAAEKMIELAPGQTRRQRFLLTRLTEYSGSLTAQVHYRPAAAGATGLPNKVYSNAVTFNVQGKPLFERDPEGFITRKEAIKLAAAEAKGEIQDARAIFVNDQETGLYLWWVSVALKDAGGPPRTVAWFVDPYRGRIWQKAKPFDPKLAEDARFKQPANLPPLPFSSRAGAPADTAPIKVNGKQ